MAKRYIDKSIEEQQAERAAGFSRRMANISDVGSDMYDTLSRMATGLAKEEVFGIPGLLGDLAEPATAIMNPVIYATNPEVRENLSEFQKDFGAVGLAKAAGVELSDEFLDESGELRPEMAGRMLAPGALYVKGASLLPKLSDGVQSLVRGLKNDGFFPAGGPQPATVSGPSFMTQAPDDAGPRSSVFLNENAGPTRGIGDNQPPSDKPLVQAEKDEMFVSPENPAVVNEKFSDEPGMGTKGFYHPLIAAFENLDLPAGGIAANKLLAMLRGQPRAGTQIRSIGLDKILMQLGTNKISPDEVRFMVDAINPKMKTRVVMKDGGEYDGESLPQTYSMGDTMQRQEGAVDTQRNYGVLLFGDEHAFQNGKYMENVGHNYFERQLPGFFGHVRFSLQEIPDPAGTGTLKALLVEEIQTDAVKLFNQKDRLEKSLPPEEAASQVQRLMGGATPYGPEEKLGDSFLNLSPEFNKFQDLQATRTLARNADEVLQGPLMNSIDEYLDGDLAQNSFKSGAASFQIMADQRKFLLANGLHNAKTEAEFLATLKALQDKGVNLPIESALRERSLNAIELQEVRTTPLLDAWKTARAIATDTVKRRQKDIAEKTGIMGSLKRAFGGENIEAELAEETRKKLVGSMSSALQLRSGRRAANNIHKRFSDDLLKARQKNIDPSLKESKFETTEAFYNRVNMADTNLVPDTSTLDKSVSVNGVEGTVRKVLHPTEVRSAFGARAKDADEVVDLELEQLGMDLDALESADPVFAGAAENFGLQSTLTSKRRLFEDDILQNIGGEKGLRQTQVEKFRDNIFDDVAKAKENEPTTAEMSAAVTAVLENDLLGPMFRKRFNLDETATAESIANYNATDFDALAQQASALTVYANQPPFKDQNEFIQFAVRALPGEAKKLGADVVVFPKAEEFVASRKSETMTPVELERFKVALEKEEKLKDASRKLAKEYKDKEIGGVELEELGIMDELGELGIADKEQLDSLSLDESFFDSTELAGLIKNALKDQQDAFMKLTGGQRFGLMSMRKTRGHLQNYGKSLDAALKKLNVPVQELDQLSAMNADRSAFKPIGNYVPVFGSANEGVRPTVAVGQNKRKEIDVPKYRMIDLREGKKGADVAKKVPSLYNKGGHVDIRGGIGAMARSVM